jgi:hypothetical protein
MLIILFSNYNIMDLNLSHQQTQLFPDPVNPNVYSPENTFHLIPQQMSQNTKYPDNYYDTNSDDSDDSDDDSDQDDSEYDDSDGFNNKVTSIYRKKKNIKKRITLTKNLLFWIPFVTIGLLLLILFMSYKNNKSIEIIRKNFEEMFEETN